MGQGRGAARDASLLPRAAFHAAAADNACLTPHRSASRAMPASTVLHAAAGRQQRRRGAAPPAGPNHFHSFLMLMFLSVSFFITFATDISKSSCGWVQTEE